eukprot:CAMPEP_0119108678 /NCGR_PEP_ID=MMETSP1180-20130426/15599_1 /TAXON_ID=3052 ORGANISM="Chlamydomonas cf sp, Strain CCMP681" /NCGR_SAMPLE_ID=MMETSP1180 /ASSEMBLY_ACC=CAM_ASM_000741 /LENGTH=403 /DNA_ID=CAMNT_0007094323 /DNA_START=93 /DNA_END=1304 /DNA_ORIENTATION=-
MQTIRRGNIAGNQRLVSKQRARTTRLCPKAVPTPGVDKGFSILTWTGKLLPQSLLVSGVKESWRLAWQTLVKELAPQDKTGAYVRPSYAMELKGHAGDAKYPAESGRYHVYVGNACPWCHRVLLVLVLRGLLRRSSSGSPHVSFTIMEDDPTRARRGGWVFGADNPDPVWGAQDLWEVYDKAVPGFQGRCTAPLLFDRKTKTLVSNESVDILRFFNELHVSGCIDVDLQPAHLAAEMDVLNEQIYRTVNNGVYASGFATSQQAYDGAQHALYQTLDQLEERLGRHRFLLGDKITESDIRLLPTIARFDAVYAYTFKCTKHRISDYPRLSAWLHEMWQLQVEGSSLQVSTTLDVDAARRSYAGNLFPLNPSGIIPAGPTAADLNLLPFAGPGLAVQDVTFARSK